MCFRTLRTGRDGGVNPTLPFDVRAARLAGRGVAILRFGKQRFIVLYRCTSERRAATGISPGPGTASLSAIASNRLPGSGRMRGGLRP